MKDTMNLPGYQDIGANDRARKNTTCARRCW